MDHLASSRGASASQVATSRVFSQWRSHAQRQGLDALQEEEGVERRHGRAEIAQQRHARLDDVGDRPERLDRLAPDRAVIAGVGRVQQRLALGCCLPVENCRRRRSGRRSRCRGRRDIWWSNRRRSPRRGRAAGEDRRGGVVHDQRDAERAADRRHLGDREDGQLRVGQGLGVVGAGPGVGGACGNSRGRTGSTKRTSMPWSFIVLANRFQVPP